MTMSDVPPELLSSILILLEPTDLIRCMCVSKTWNASIRNPRFIKLHHQRSIETNSSARTIILGLPVTTLNPHFLLLPFYDDTFGPAVEIVATQPLKPPNGAFIVIVGSSNGLVCIRNRYSFNNGFALWNPSIQKLKKIPDPGPKPEPEPHQSHMDPGLIIEEHYGFGYDSSNDDYKLVQVVEIYNEEDDMYPPSPTPRVVESCQVSVYSLKSNSWKRIQSMPSLPCNGFGLARYHYAVCLNSALSWLMMDDDQHEGRILTLDLASEEYSFFPIPFPVDENLTFGSLGGYLCICNYNSDEHRHDVWVMKESWTLLSSLISRSDVPPSLYVFSSSTVKPLEFSKNGEMVLLLIDNRQLIWFDIHKRKIVKPVEIGAQLRVFEATICEGVGSLCFLLDGDPVSLVKATKEEEEEEEDEN